MLKLKKKNTDNGEVAKYVTGKDYRMGTIVTRLPHSAVTEQFRTLRTNVEFSMIDKTVKSIIVTSAKSGSGKSTVAANLSAVLVNKNRRVLLVDSDLRRPTVHKIFNYKNDHGLSNLMTDEQGLLNDYVLFDRASGLYVLTSGSTPHNPAEILGSNRMKKMIAEMKKQYDIIVFDAPPVLSVTDAQILSSEVDGILFVIPYGQLSLDEAAKAKAALEKVDANILGAVLNRIEEKLVDDLYY